MKKSIQTLWFLLALLAIGCATTSPFEHLKRDLNRYPEYTIMLEDMKEEGNFFKEYYHRYKAIYAEPTGVADSLVYHTALTDWVRVDKEEYEKNWNHLGMVLASKTRDGNLSTTPYPPGYQYVGNPRYGTWRRDERGNSFWEFYGKWAFFNHMFGMFGRPIYRSSWDNYRDYQRRGTPYYGPRREYGTTGRYTKTTQKSFFERRRAQEQARKARFADRVKQRVRRSNMSGIRRRSGGFGK